MRFLLPSILLLLFASALQADEPKELTPAEKSAVSVLGVEAKGPGDDLVRRGSGFVRDRGVVVTSLDVVRGADEISVKYASLDVETVSTRVLAIDHAHGLVLLAADTAKHEAPPLALHDPLPKAAGILIVVSRSPAGVVKARPLTVSAVNEVPGLGPTIRFESALEMEQDGAVLFTPGAKVAGVLRVHELDGETFGYGAPATVIQAMTADSLWVTPPLEEEPARVRALKALLDGDCGVAVAHLRARLEAEPKHPGLATTHWQLGRCLESLGRAGEAATSYRAAEEAYRRAGAFDDTDREIEVWTAIARVQPKAADARRALIVLHLERGADAAAVQALRELVELEPKDANIHYDLGDTWIRLGKPMDAVAALKQAAVLDPNLPGIWLQLGLVYEDLGDAKAALAAYEQAAQRKPDNVTAHRGLGWAHAELGEWAKAWQAFEKAHQLDPKSAATLYDLALCYHRLGFDAKLVEAQKKLKMLDLVLSARLVAAVGDRTSTPDQIYEAGPNFPVARIREYWKKPFRITDMAYGDGEWGVVLTRQAKPLPQKYRSDTKISRETWNGFRKEGYALTSLARRAEHWVSTWTQDPSVKSQSLMVVAGLPEDDLRTRLAKGLRITSIARGRGMWGIVMSYPSPYAEQIWLRGSEVPAEAIQARWKEGYRITDAGYGEGRWVIVLSKNSGLGEQDWVVSPSFPEQDVKTRWSEGYQISTLARGGGRWLVVLSTDADSS